MPATFYIENDEEIISVIGRLRTSPDEENFFVLPKRALILQSIVNLRLFAREAQKMNKKVVIVTQDEIGRMLAEKAGLPTENYSDTYAERDRHVELTRQESALPPLSPPAAPEPEPTADLPRSTSLGSSAFFDGTAPEADIPPAAPEPVPGPLPEPQPSPQRLRIRNASPERTPALNSKRFAAPEPLPPSAPKPERPIEPTRRPDAPMAGGFPMREDLSAPVSRSQVSGERKDALKRFFSESPAAPRPARPPMAPPAMPKAVKPAPLPKPEKPAKPVSPRVHHYSFRRIFIPLGLLTFFSLAAVLAFIFLPSVDVYVTPQTADRKLDLDLQGKSGEGVEAAGTTLPVWTLESDVTVTVSEEASGIPTTGSSERASGTVTLYNDYGSEPQTLVATTRLETEDGKIFRLIDAVEVPGKSGSNPGSVQARVMADRAGSEYNIGPSTFTIPGFKGSDKFSAFKAESTAPMQGGGGEGSDDATITQSDLDRAERKAAAQAREQVTEALSGYLKDGEALIEPTLRIEETADRSGIPAEGTTAGTFEYSRTYHGLAYAYSEEFLRRLVEENFGEAGSGGVVLKPSRITTEFGEVTENQEAKELSITLHAELALVADIDEGALESALLGKNTDGIEAALKDFPSVAKIRLEFHPDWIRGNIPRSESRVNLVLETPAPEE